MPDCSPEQAARSDSAIRPAVGMAPWPSAACSRPRDAQALLGPLVLVTAMPLFTLGTLLQDPAGRLASVLSFFPLSAPLVMCFRLNSHPAPPAWDVAVTGEEKLPVGVA